MDNLQDLPMIENEPQVDDVDPVEKPKPAAPVPTLDEDLAALDALEKKLFSHRYAIDEIGSLGEVIDPEDALAERSEALALLEEERIETLCAPEVGAMLERLGKASAQLETMRRAQVKVLTRDRASLVDVPLEEQVAFSRLTSEANDVWHKAKLAGDWDAFEPYVDRFVAAKIRIAQAMKPGQDPYDVWLNEYEQGTSRAFYDPFFSQVKDCVVPLLADCMASEHKPNHAACDGHFDEARQWELAHDLMELEGVNPRRLWVGKTEHPFTGGPGIGFVLIASHVYPDNVLSNVFSMLHEGGHTLYEQGVDMSFAMTSLKGGTSMGMHEAQSRFFENIVGRSEAFARPLLKVLQGRFPGQFGRVTPYQLFMAENCAEPCLIRCDADELTYPLHILVRYEIEQLLFSGEATAKDVPGLWAAKYKEYLGLDVPNHTDGALQDTHWSGGDFGYFPTYALGSAFGAQFKAAMVAQGMDFDGVCASGDLAPIRAWLGEKIWRHGRAKDSAELIEAACGEPFSPTYYTDYLTEKFTRVYQL